MTTIKLILNGLVTLVLSTPVLAHGDPIKHLDIEQLVLRAPITQDPEVRYEVRSQLNITKASITDNREPDHTGYVNDPASFTLLTTFTASVLSGLAFTP